MVEAARFVAVLLNSVTFPAPLGANVIAPVIALLVLPRLIAAADSVDVNVAVAAVTGCVCVIAPAAVIVSVLFPMITPFSPLAVPMISGALLVKLTDPPVLAASVPTLFAFVSVTDAAESTRRVVAVIVAPPVVETPPFGPPSHTAPPFRFV